MRETMVSAATIAEHIPGLPSNEGAVAPVCDCPHEPPQAVDYDRHVQYECVRIGNSMPFLEPLPQRGRWLGDLLRCADCEIESLQDPTSGYGEVLLELDIAWHADHLVNDARDLEVLDHSPVDVGRDPPNVPREVALDVYERHDGGLLRRSRLADYVFTLRRGNRDEQADAIDQQL